MYNLPTSRTATCSPSHNPSAACAVHRECPGSTETPSTLQTACACLHQQPPLSKPHLKSQSRTAFAHVMKFWIASCSDASVSAPSRTKA